MPLFRSLSLLSASVCVTNVTVVPEWDCQAWPGGEMGVREAAPSDPCTPGLCVSSTKMRQPAL